MLKNYLAVALRNIARNKLFSVVNILGLAFGIGSALLIFLWINDELLMDQFHAQGDRIYRVMENQQYSDGRMYTFNSTPAPMVPFVKDKYPEIEKATRLTWNVNDLFQVGEKTFYQNGRYADQDFLDMFSWPMISGVRESALKDKSSIVIGKAMAEKFFGKEDPIGKTLLMNTKHSFIVSGVLDDLPVSSNLKFDFIIPFQFFWDENKSWLDQWDNNNVRGLLLLRPDVDVQAFTEKFRDEVKAHVPYTNVKLHLQRSREAYLYGDYSNGVQSGGRIEYVRIFFIVAVFVLVIACINFMNLATAQAAKRSKEVGLRKVIGAYPRQLFRQFMGESFVTVGLSSAIAVGLVLLVLPFFNDLTGKQLSLYLLDVRVALIFLVVVVVTSILAGSYPAIFISDFKPVQVLKGQLQTGRKAAFFRKTLVVVQFSLSMVLIISTLVVFRQMSFMGNRDIGFDRDNVFYIWAQGDMSKKWETIRERLLSEPGIESVTASGQLPIDIGNSTMGVNWEGKNPDDKFLFTNVDVDYEFVQTMKMEMVEGRPFDRNIISDSVNYLVNEVAAAKFNFKNGTANHEITMWDRKGKIVGVVKNFNFGSLHNAIEPLILRNPGKDRSGLACMIIRAKEGENDVALKAAEKLWKEYAPNYPFIYKYMNQDWENFYQAEGQRGKVFNALSMLSIFISCLGLFGLSAYSAERRTKEIGIRKVLGASVPGLMGLMGREFAILVLVAAALGCPAGWYLMDKWLTTYAFHVDVGWISLASAALACLAISLFTVAYHSLRASTANPVHSLRYE